LKKEFNEYVIKYLAILEFENSKRVLVEEDINGVDLSQILPISGFEVKEFLKIAIQIVCGLQAIHQQGLIHKDLKSANIIIDKLNNIKIIDFSNSSQARQEKSMEISRKTGTLLYISPEQTGRVNRHIDYRSDFYSLGVTFYELITGELPFLGDALSVIQHLAKQAIEPHKIKKEIPLFLSQVIMKLLAKNPEERYQSNQGILYDLNLLLSDTNLSSAIIGQQDFSEKFIIPQKIYGREAEIKILLEIFEKSINGKPIVLLVKGYPGVGKTSVINEIQQPLMMKGGYFISGKFDQLNKGSAYYAIIQAFQELIKQLLTENLISLHF